MSQKKLFYLGIIFSFLFSCNDHPTESKHDSVKLQIRDIYKTGGGMAHGERHVDMAAHYLILKEYYEDDTNAWSNFIQFADNYRDTVQSDLPLSSITICKPFNTDRNFSGGDGWMEMRENSIISIHYSRQTMHEKLADISSLVFWKNGEPYSIELLTEDRMEKRGYFDSTNGDHLKWMDRYKNQPKPSEDTM